MILVLILSSGCQSFVKDKSKEYAAAALEGARTWWETGGKEDTIGVATAAAVSASESLLDKADEKFEEKYGNPPSFYSNPDGSTDWAGLMEKGIGAMLAYAALHKGRVTLGKMKEKKTDGLVAAVASKVSGPPPGAV